VNESSADADALDRDSNVQQQALERYGFFLDEVSADVGMSFRHESPQLDAKLEHIMPQVAAMGAAVAVGDYDRDGWSDIYVTNSAVGSSNALYRNRGDGTFEDVAPRLGVATLNEVGTGVSIGALWGDYNNDGYEDLFVYKWGRSELLRNDAGQSFTRVSEDTALPDWANLGAAAWLDFDRDGYLDLFAAGYYHEDVDLWRLDHTAIPVAQSWQRYFRRCRRRDGGSESSLEPGRRRRGPARDRLS
jgi:hypothetical protein